MPFIEKANRVEYEENGAILAEVDFPAAGDDVVDIAHTFVDNSLRGRGIAGQLMERTAALLRRDGRRAVLTCSYAKKWFADHPDAADVLK